MDLKSRVVGIDAVRGLAILGMFAAHVGPRGEAHWGWLWVFDGRSAATFAFLVGVSMSLLARGHDVAHSRARIATRATLLILLGFILKALQTPVVVILVNTGVFMLLGMWALRWRVRTLLMSALPFLLVGPFVYHWWVNSVIAPQYDSCLEGSCGPRPAPVVDTLWGYYPVVVWMGLVLVGMAVGKIALERVSTLAVVAASGLALAGLAYALGTVFVPAAVSIRGDTLASGWWWGLEPHSYTPVEVCGALGVSLVLVAVFCAIALAAKEILLPLYAVGAMALTAYAGHLLAIWWFRNAPVYDRSVTEFLWFVGVTVVVCVSWRFAVGRGPLEAGLHAASLRMAGPEPKDRG